MSPIVLALAATALPALPGSYVQFAREGDFHVVRNIIDDTPVYTFDADEEGKSHCDEACAREWRPLFAASDAQPVGLWTIIRRSDDSQQWAFAGKPVYSFARDPEPVSLGSGKVGNWHLLPKAPVQ
jgi:predicted lipoprotein with Yx(FWY)xxD motif